MKTRTKLFLVVAIIIGLAACNKTDEPIDNSIEGTYSGILTNKSASGTIIGTGNATADISKTSDGLIEVHCYGNAVDTTFMLNYFENHDSVMVCLNGEDFKHMYGHIYGQGHMGGGMMGDKTNGETEWQHHMDDEHQQGDEHFGGFDMGNQTFGYHFKMMNGNMPYYLDFQGKKN